MALVVFAVLGVSLIESLFFLPAPQSKDRPPGRIVRWIDERQDRISALLQREVVDKAYYARILTEKAFLLR